MSDHPADVCVKIATAFRLTASGMRRGTRYQEMSPTAWDSYAELLEALSGHIRDLERRSQIPTPCSGEQK